MIKSPEHAVAANHEVLPNKLVKEDLPKSATHPSEAHEEPTAAE